MKILEYNDLDISKVRRQYEKVIGFLEQDDFRSAEVKKLPEYDLYRAKLDDSNRLLFRIVNYEGARYALALEVVLNHAYDKSKFLRGVRIDESKIPVFEKVELEKEKLPSLVYVNSSDRCFHLLDKVISFDPEQQEIFRLQGPLIIIGPAGSGKTALTLEKMKRVHGRVLYVTLSRYLADNSRNIYYSHRYENEDQEISFLSFREFLETMRVPEGREISYRVFSGWLMRFPKQQRVSDAHRLYEEFRGVMTGSIIDKPFLGKEDYMALGIRRSVYLERERELVYTLFEKYLAFLKDNGYYDPNILAHAYLRHVRPEYDFIVVDEVQDITNIQLQLVLRSIKKAGDFILCGDSNQIVHPNFFSWSNIKSMFYTDETIEVQKLTRILQSNFRNSTAVIGLANKLLKIRQKRFGSIDRESNYLMNSQSEQPGEIVFVKDTERAKKELNQKIRRSTKFAVLVMREEDKTAVRQFFDSPLLFSVQEAKGLEYENVVLVDFISGERASFQEIIGGVDAEDLDAELEYMRARDKKDKSHEVYKFFINSLYVAVTRAVRNLYLIESDTGHPLIGMLGVQDAKETAAVEATQSSLEEWQAEAHRLELQGRQEQADEIRRDILKTQPVPWDVYTAERIAALLERACDPKEISQKPAKAVFDYSLFYNDHLLMEALAEHGFEKAKKFSTVVSGHRFFEPELYMPQRAQFVAGFLHKYSGKFFKDVLSDCERYGIDHRTAFNKTPLMLAALAGNIMLIEKLLSGGANSELTDNYGLTAWQSALQRATQDSKFASEFFNGVHEILAPSSVSLKVDERLLKIDSVQGEFLIFHLFLTELRSRINKKYLGLAAMTAPVLARIAEQLPDSALPGYRKKRSYISSLLSKNELGSDNPYNKKLFVRKRTGKYILNPKIAVLQGEDWIDIYRHANIGLFADSDSEAGKHINSVVQFLLSENKLEDRDVDQTQVQPKDDALF